LVKKNFYIAYSFKQSSVSFHSLYPSNITGFTHHTLNDVMLKTATHSLSQNQTAACLRKECGLQKNVKKNLRNNYHKLMHNLGSTFPKRKHFKIQAICIVYFVDLK